MPRRDTLVRIPVALLLLACALLVALLLTPAAWARQAPFTGRVLAVPAGDSLEVADEHEQSVLVRLHGIECPHAPRPLKEVCARFTARLALGRMVSVIPQGRGLDGALWAEVFLDPDAPAGADAPGVRLSATLVEAGLARWKRVYAPERTDLQQAQERAAAARRGLWGASDGSNVPLLAVVPPSVPVRPPASPTIRPQEPVSTPTRNLLQPGYIGVLAVYLIASGVTLGAFVLRDIGSRTEGVAGDALKAGSPTSRFGARMLVSAIGGVAAALLAALPQALMRMSVMGSDLSPSGPGGPLRTVGVGGFALLAALVLGRGALCYARARRWSAAPELDPARSSSSAVAAMAALPVFGRVHGIARAAANLEDGGALVRSGTSPVHGLWLREAAGVYAIERRRAGGGRPRGRWRQVMTETDAGSFRIESDAGDGTGAALVRWGDGDASNAALRVFPFVVARYYNGMAVRRWFRMPYEGDTRAEIQVLPDGAHITAWGILLPPVEPCSLPELVPDPLTGALLVADDAVASRVGARERVAAVLCLSGGLVLAASAIGLAFLGSGDTIARAALYSSLGVVLLAGLVSGLQWTVRFTNAARGVPDRASAALRLRQWRETRLGRLLTVAVG